MMADSGFNFEPIFFDEFSFGTELERIDGGLCQWHTFSKRPAFLRVEEPDA